MSETFDRLAELRQQLEDKRDSAKHNFEEKERDLQAVLKTMELLRSQGREDVVVTLTGEAALVLELRRKKTQLHALIAIARNNGGKLLTRDAKRLLQQAGLMKQTKNASNILYNVINRSERFKHVGSGEYELKAESKSRVESDGVFHTPVQ
jgi:hypothetical protein